MSKLQAADYQVRRKSYEHFQNNLRLRNLRLLADAQVAQFYLPKTPENRGKHITHDTFSRWMEGVNPTGQGIGAARTLAQRKRFGHWFLEFWDVVDAGGFDLIIGNPPYLGGSKLSGSYSHAFCEWVKWEYAPTGLSELVVFFLRRIYDLLRPGGFVALITTNSIKDGDIRADGLEQVMRQGGNLTFAVSGIKWPGVANLFVSLFSLHKGLWENKPRILDNKEVPFISAMFSGYADAGAPVVLEQNKGCLFEGSKFLGDGFLLEHAEAHEMVERDARFAQIIFPVINGDELNNEPLQKPQRSIINFFDWPLEKAEAFGEAFERVRTLVKPVRDIDNRPVRRERWWQYAERAVGLYEGIRGRERCFVVARTTKHLNFSASPCRRVFTDALKVFTTDLWSNYAVVQSTLHEVWARKYSGSLETRLRYSPTDCFLTFAFPNATASDASLTAIGETYHEYRRTLMRDLWLGLTDLYNLFHAPDLEQRLTELFEKRAAKGEWQVAEGVPTDHKPLDIYHSPTEALQGIQRLRDLHRELDQAVLTAYGWHADSDFGPDLALRHDFYDVDYLPENDRTRYTIHPDARREVLARLLKLNHSRAAEAESAIQSAVPEPNKKSKAKKSNVSSSQELELGLDMSGRPATPLSTDRRQPAGKRTTLGGIGYAIQLVRALLNESEGTLAWPRLVDAFTLATQPVLMCQKTASPDAARVKAWSKRWKEVLPPGSLLTAIEQLGSQNLAARRAGTTWTISLKDGPKATASDDANYDAWLALRVLGAASVTQEAKTTLVIPEFDDWTKRMETMLVA